MFNKDFYPTPERVAFKMLEGVDLRYVGCVLEPSAGKGDLVEHMMRKYGCSEVSKIDLDVIEVEPELRAILKGKRFRVVHDDFMTYNTYKKYDLIISNPPFSNGAKHLLKMIEMQERFGGAVICLLNAETIKNPYTNDRKTLVRKLEEYGADISYMDGAFSEAERKTNVEVAIIKIVIPEKEKVSMIFEESMKKARDLEYMEKEEQENTQLAENDFIRAIVRQFNVEVEAGIRLIEEYKAMRPNIMRQFDGKGHSIMRLAMYDDRSGVGEVTYNDYVRAVRRKYWSALFENPKFTGKLTSKLLSDFRSRVEELVHYDFSVYNIMTIREEMQKSVIKGVEEAIIELFDELSHKHSWRDESSQNIHYYNGWKTNKSWIIGKKVIIPLNAYEYSYCSGKYEFRPNKWDLVGKLADIEKGFNYLDGGLTENIELRDTLQKAKDEGKTRKIQLKYFTVTFYKKGTCHIEFTNLELLKKFNIFGSQKKGWLPPSYGKAKYEDMSKEEKEVVESFEGKKSYEKVLINKMYYLNNSGLLLLE